MGNRRRFSGDLYVRGKYRDVMVVRQITPRFLPWDHWHPQVNFERCSTRPARYAVRSVVRSVLYTALGPILAACHDLNSFLSSMNAISQHGALKWLKRSGVNLRFFASGTSGRS